MTILDIPFKQAFRHATASRARTESVLVKATNSHGLVGLGEGCPRSYVTGETVETAQSFFETHRQSWESWQGLEDLRTWMIDNPRLIDMNPSAWCAVELAQLDLWGKEQGQSIEVLLGLPEVTGSFQYSAVLGADSLSTFQKQAAQFSTLGFVDFKVKVSGTLEEDQCKINLLKRLDVKDLRIRLDANNLWKYPEQTVAYLQSLHCSFLAIEEPLQVGDYEGSRTINRQLGLPIILDESFLREEQLQNVKGTRAGGLLISGFPKWEASSDPWLSQRKPVKRASRSSSARKSARRVSSRGRRSRLPINAGEISWLKKGPMEPICSNATSPTSLSCSAKAENWTPNPSPATQGWASCSQDYRRSSFYPA